MQGSPQVPSPTPCNGQLPLHALPGPHSGHSPHCSDSHPDETLPHPGCKAQTCLRFTIPGACASRASASPGGGSENSACTRASTEGPDTAPGQRMGWPSFWGLLCSFDQLSSLHTTPTACSLSQWPCPPSATMILHLHICTSTSGGPAWLLPYLPGGTHGGGRTTSCDLGGSAPCLSLGLTGKGLGSGPVNCSS